MPAQMRRFNPRVFADWASEAIRRHFINSENKEFRAFCIADAATGNAVLVFCLVQRYGIAWGPGTALDLQR